MTAAEKETKLKELKSSFYDAQAAKEHYEQQMQEINRAIAAVSRTQTEESKAPENGSETREPERVTA